MTPELAAELLAIARNISGQAAVFMLVSAFAQLVTVFALGVLVVRSLVPR